ncbi:hypothetical protein VP150E351_P0205 [Vibrio phage 150E35-1]|nr:hypothetical protein VP150E351_P0205 [Vibrio phage 150E35-1]
MVVVVVFIGFPLTLYSHRVVLPLDTATEVTAMNLFIE